MQQAAEAHLRLQHDLRLAITNNQLHLYFQPQYDFEEQLVSAEALLRWQHPKQGEIKPRTIIPTAEESGQILPISEWVLKHALMLSKPWMHNTNNLRRIAININAAHFHQVGFAEQVKSILMELSFNPKQLTLEIHENTLSENLEEAKQKILALKELGVRFSIDSFGTGYASLAYLRQLSLDELKIDRSFIRDITSDPKDAKLVNTIITMAHQMEIEAIAVGVETEAQLQFLRNNGCKLFQGYYFERPLLAQEFESNLMKQLA
jgi:EAL domain-containing protein (putative c-di-GMP-specific phosphodiesterase class I)